METRILVKEDFARLYEIEAAALNEKADLRNKALKFVSKFNNLGFEDPLDNETFQTILTDGVEALAQSSQDIVMAELKASGLRSEVIMRPALDEQSQRIREAISAFNELKAYDDKKPQINGLKFSTDDVVIEGLDVIIESDLDIDALKDSYARTFIEGELGLALYEKGEELAALFNQINGIIRTAGGFNINDTADFSDLATWKWKGSDGRASAEAIVNTEGVYRRSRDIERRSRTI